MSAFQISRRGFMQAGAAAVGVTSLGHMMGSSALAAIDPNSHGQRVFHASHYGPFEAVVRDGRITAISPITELDHQPTDMLMLGVMDRTYDDSRILYPMVRKSYLDGWQSGDTKPELRGKEEFVQVDWDTALALTANAIVKTIEENGNEAIFSSSYGGWSNAGSFRPNVMQQRFFNLVGGCTITQGDFSAGASQVALPHIIGDMEVYSPQTAWEVVRDNTEVFVLVGCDPVKNNRIEFTVADHGMSRPWAEIRDAGCRFISINPQRTASDSYLNADWVQIVPNTDIALFLGMAHHVLEQGLEDRAYIEKYTTGADRWIAYVKGEDDGTAKTPDWAAGITGIPADKIREMAELFAKSRTQFGGAWSLQRAHHGELTHHAIINFAALIGKIGKPGEGVGFSWHYGSGGMPQSGQPTPTGLSAGKNLVDKLCPASRIVEMLENPGKEFFYNGQTRTYPDIRMIYNAGNNFVSHQQDLNRLLKAFGKLHTIVSQDVWWTAAVRWADIVLPASSTLERDDISVGGTYSNDKIYAMKKVIEPQGESMSDYEIFEALADKMGLWAQFTDSVDYMDHIRAAYERTGASKTTPFEEFWEKGYALQPAPPEARKWVRHGAFYEDPEANPLHTLSGKIEMFCSSIADMNVADNPGMPVWQEPLEYLGNAKEGQLHIVSPHPWYRLHSQMDNSAKLRELYKIDGREPVRMNRQDAEVRGIADGDLVEIRNERGAVIAGAVLSDDIMPGVMSLYEGAWPDLDSKGRCNSGQINWITSERPASGLTQATIANTCVASVAKCEDAERPNQAHQKPAILTDYQFAAIDESELGLDRVADIVESLYAEMEEGERIFYQRCTVCHGPRDPGGFTQLQWRGITPSMFPRAGLDDDEAALVTDFLMRNASDAAVAN